MPTETHAGHLLTVHVTDWDRVAGGSRASTRSVYTRRGVAETLVDMSKIGWSPVLVAAVPLTRHEWAVLEEHRANDAWPVVFGEALGSRAALDAAPDAGPTGGTPLAVATRWLRDGDRPARETVYLAHPVAAHPELGETIASNAARARRWLRILMDAHPTVAFVCPWLPFLDVGDEADTAYRARCLVDDVAIAMTCRGIVLVGGRVSDGMSLEREAVRSVGGVVIDLTHLGATCHGFDVRELRKTDIAALVARPRRRP